MRCITLLLVIFFNQTQAQYTTISIKVKDSLRRNIVFFEPINDHANRSIPTYAIQNNNSNEVIINRKIQIANPVAIEIHFGFEPLWLYIEPNQHIYIDINLNLFTSNSTNGGLKIRGPNSKGNEYFNEFNFLPGKKFTLIDDIISNCNPEKVEKTIRYFQQKIDSSFQHLKVLKYKKLVSSCFYNLVTSDLSLAYVSEFGLQLLNSKKEYYHKCEIMDSLYQVYKPENKQNLQGFFNNSYYYRYGVYKNTKSYNSALLQKDTILKISSSYYEIVKNFIPFIYLKGEIMKFEWGMALYQYKTFFPEKFEERDETSYFAKFQDSWLHRFINLKVENKNNTTASNFISSIDSSRIVILNADSLTSLKNVLNVFFKNKLVYVDFWATWCLPCKEEFSFNKFIDSFCVKNNIERLYVSFDLPGDRQKVLKNIYSFKLYGKHLLLNKHLFDDIINKIYGGSSRYSIPRYLIINKKNEIVETDAKRPSSGKALLDQLKLYIDE